jgi:hypothetical protein
MAAAAEVATGTPIKILVTTIKDDLLDLEPPSHALVGFPRDREVSMRNLVGALAPDELKMLAFIGRSEDPILCDRGAVGQLLSKGLVERTAMGWMISPTGRLRLHMRR